jgi:predicted Zn finger-like uncharacterized protein
VASVEDLIELIKDDYANDYRRVWSLSDRVIGIFTHESIGLSVYSIMTVFDYDSKEESCELLIRYSGGALSLIGTGRSEDFITGMAKAISSLAEHKGWQCRIEKAKVRPAGAQCPRCGASYKYQKKKIREDGTVDCQNCGKPFTLT